MAESLNPNLNVSQQLLLLRRYTEMTGALHDAQVTQLKFWGIGLYDEVRSIEVGFDFENKQITYRLVSKIKQFENQDRKGEVLDKCIKDLLGPLYSVKVVYKKKVLFQSESINNSKPVVSTVEK